MRILVLYLLTFAIGIAVSTASVGSPGIDKEPTKTEINKESMCKMEVSVNNVYELNAYEYPPSETVGAALVLFYSNPGLNSKRYRFLFKPQRCLVARNYCYSVKLTKAEYARRFVYPVKLC